MWLLWRLRWKIEDVKRALITFHRLIGAHNNRSCEILTQLGYVKAMKNHKSLYVLVFIFVLVLFLVFEGVKSKEEPFAPCCREGTSTAAKRKKTQPHFQFYRRVKDKCFHKVLLVGPTPPPLSVFMIPRYLLSVMRILLSCCRSIFPLPKLLWPSPHRPHPCFLLPVSQQ